MKFKKGKLSKKNDIPKYLLFDQNEKSKVKEKSVNKLELKI